MLCLETMCISGVGGGGAGGLSKNLAKSLKIWEKSLKIWG